MDAVLITIAVLVPLLALLDAENIFTPFRPALGLQPERDDDFTILVPLYGHPRYFRNEAYLRRHRHNVILVVNTGTAAMRRFANAREWEGWRLVRVHVAAVHSPMDMIAAALEHVRTDYVIRLDGDTWTWDDVGRAVAAMRREQVDLCSAKILPARRETVAERMQGVEYDLAMRGRHHRPWMTSGAITLARTDALRAVMRHHSNYFYGEDLEVGKIAKCLGMRVKHADLTVFTEVPATFRELVRQRIGWWCGSFRSAFVNIDKNLRFPVYWAYNLLLVWLLLTGKLISGVSAYELVPAVILLYTGLIVVCNWPVRSRWMVLFPYYSLCQVLVMPALGVARYVALLRATGHWGRYRYPTLAVGRWRDAALAPAAAGRAPGAPTSERGG